MSDRSLEERIRLRLLVEGGPFDITGENGPYVELADAARIAALEAEDSYRENAITEALKMIIERPFPLKPKEDA